MPEPIVVDPDTAEQFRDDGVAVLRDVLTSDRIEALRAGVEHNRTRPSEWAHWYTDPGEPVGFWSDYVTWRSVPEYRSIVFESGLAGIAGQLMGSHTTRFFHEHVLVKEPGAVERTPWHHDQPYYCVDGDQNVSMWITLDPVPAETAMRFLAGSHRWNRWFIPRRFVDHVPYAPETDRYELLPDIDAMLAADPLGHRVRSFAVAPGDVIVFHFRTLHDAPGNPSTGRRRVVSLRWLGDDAVWAERPWQVSPPFEPEGLRPGDPLDERFPLVIG